MDKRYKIGDLEKIFGIPVQTLRFYESRGLIKPIKDPVNGYRYYDNWTINFILDVIQLRQYGFSLNEINQIFCSNNLNTVVEEFNIKKSSLIKEIDRLQTIVELLDKQNDKIQKLNSQIFNLVDSPQLLFHTYRSKEVLKEYKNIGVETIKWINLIPKAEPSFLIDSNNIDADTDYRWGYSINIREAIKEKLDFSNNIIIFSKKAIHTTFEARNEKTFISSLIEQVVQPIKNEGYQIVGKPYGKLIIRTNIPNGIKRYFEVYVPVHK